MPLDEPVSADHVQAKARPGPIFGTFFWPLSRRILFETTQILEPFWFLFLGRELYQVTAFYHLLDDLAAQVGPEKMHVLAELVQMKQVLAIRVGAKKAVGAFYVSKKW